MTVNCNHPDPREEAALRSRLSSVRRVVVKIGSRALLDEDNHLDESRVASLAGQMSRLQREGREVVCVSSGAVAAGLRVLGRMKRPTDLPGLQAAAAIGQAHLMEIYRRVFAEEGIPVGQVLLTHEDLRSRERHLNARNTLNHLLRNGVVPIINENDTVAVEEIRVGDNDMLSALVALLVRAEVLILLTTEDGLYSRPPGKTPGKTSGEGGTLISSVREITAEIRDMAGPLDQAGDGLSRGGMESKLAAAEMVMRSGEFAVIAGAHEPEVLRRILEGEGLGTIFLPRIERMTGRKRWIAFFDHPRGGLHIDAGAARALQEEGRSLLAVGIVSLSGQFKRGEPVRIIDPEGGEIARGLVNYPGEELERILGCTTPEIGRILGSCEYEEVVHRDNLVLA